MRGIFSNLHWLGAAIVLLTALAIPARADLIGNLQSSYNNDSNIGQGLTAAMGFTMGSSSYSLTDAQVVLTLQAVTSNPPSLSNAPLLQLWSDVSGAPGAALLTFTAPTLTNGTAQTFTFTPSSSFSLQANTSYFLYLTSSNSGGAYFQWLADNPGVTPTGPGATFLSSTTSVDNSFQIDGQIQSDVVVVPEPSSLFAVAAISPVGFGFWWFKRRRIAA
jgi:hypothetical protein